MVPKVGMTVFVVTVKEWFVTIAARVLAVKMQIPIRNARTEKIKNRITTRIHASIANGETQFDPVSAEAFWHKTKAAA